MKNQFTHFPVATRFRSLLWLMAFLLSGLSTQAQTTSHPAHYPPGNAGVQSFLF
ncbi:MAG: hypothetical protein LH606_05615 [Cytophagaceae bacterium]|nr:hypothetical protein [Cytophagaceae bacterium]